MINLCNKIDFILVTPVTPTLNRQDISAIKVTVNNLGSISGWNDFYETLDKEKKDHIALWGSGKHLPNSAKFIKTWGKEALITDENWSLITTSLTLSKAIDELKRSGLLIARDKLSSLTADEYYTQILSKFSIRGSAAFKELSELHELFHSDSNKGFIKDKSRQVIDSAYDSIKSSSNLQCFEFLVKRADAHWYVFNGNLKKASEIYKALIMDCQYTSGPHLQEILQEALVVGAQLQLPDKVLLKKAYNIQVLFGFDDDYVNTEGVISNKYDDNVEIWLVRHWKKQFGHLFPSKLYFDDVNYNLLSPIAIVGPADELDRPDYRNPNRFVSYKSLDRKIPQLNYWIHEGKVSVVEKLIEKGADVCVSSDQNETPLILALQGIDKENPLYRPDFEKLPWLIINQLKEKGCKEYINLKTQRTQFRALELAISSNNPLLVKTIIELGADINDSSCFSHVPPLYYALLKLSSIKDVLAGHGLNTDKGQPVSRETSIRYGVPGYKPEQKKLKEAMEVVVNRVESNLRTYCTLENIRHICAILILSGADVNEKVSLANGLQYTPLALCAELNELELFKLMLEYGGDINFSYSDKRHNRKVTLYDIAREFQSGQIKSVLTLLKG